MEVGFAGPAPSAVQSHMTSLASPIEILEARLSRCAWNRFRPAAGSGGSGRWPGGDGWCGRSAFSSRMTAAILSDRARWRLRLAAGWSGQPGRNRWIGADGREQELGEH